MSLNKFPQQIMASVLRYYSHNLTIASRSIVSLPFQNYTTLKVKLSNSELLKEPSRGMAGHSKWQNIKHTKEAKDQERSRLFSKISMGIRMAIAGGQTDPSLNAALASAIADAKKANMPASKIENLLKTDGKKFENGMCEIKGPRGSFLLVQLYSDALRRTTSNIRSVVKRIEGFSVSDHVRSTNGIFELKGIIQTEAAGPDGKPISIDKATEDAIVSGAEEVQEFQDDDDKAMLQFSCDHLQLHNVRKNLEETGTYVICSADNEYIPLTVVALKENELVNFQKLSEKLDTFTEIVNIYDNFA